MGMLEVEYYIHGSANVLGLSGWLACGSDSADKLKAELLGLISKGRQYIVVNMADVRKTAEEGLQALLEVGRNLPSGWPKLRLCRVPPDALQLIERTGEADRFEIHENEIGAVQSFQSP